MSSAHLLRCLASCGKADRASASSALEFRRHEQKRKRLRATFGALDGLPRFGRGERRKHLFEHLSRIGICTETAGELIGDVETLRQPVEPGRTLVGEALGS
jgi:hypothetical protein